MTTLDTQDIRDGTAGQVGQGSTEVPEGTGQDPDDQGDAEDRDDDGNPNHRRGPLSDRTE